MGDAQPAAGCLHWLGVNAFSSENIRTIDFGLLSRNTRRRSAKAHEDGSWRRRRFRRPAALPLPLRRSVAMRAGLIECSDV